jgi:hypothetical protein
MPSKSPAQEKLMRAVAHSPEFAKKVDIPQSVGKDFHEADKKKSSQYSLPKSSGAKAMKLKGC